MHCTSTHNTGNFFEHPSSEGRKSRADKKHWKVVHIPSDFPLGSEQQQTENWVGILIALTHDTYKLRASSTKLQVSNA